VIAVEQLNVQNMSKRPAPQQDEATQDYLPNGASQKAGLNKSIVDAAWSMFRHVLTYKSESAGRQVVNINPAWTSQECSGCGTRVKKQLSQRVHDCPNCGLCLDRDLNAARNILKVALHHGEGANAVGQHSIAALTA
jgi:putative transposase